MDQTQKILDNEGEKFKNNKDNYDIAEYGKEEDKPKTKKIRQAKDAYSSDWHSELTNNATTNKEVNYQESATVTDEGENAKWTQVTKMQQ